jgi:hypothetical protein
MAVAGYNIAFKYYANEQFQFAIAGSVQDDMTIAARTKDRVTKDDAGVSQFAVTGQDVTFKVSGLCIIYGDNESGPPGRDWWLGQILAGTEFPFVYLMDGGATVSGTAVMTNYTESSNATDDATFTADFRVTGTATVA